MSSFEGLRLSGSEVAHLAITHFDLHGQVLPLTGEVDFNYRLTTSTGKHFLLKISRLNPDVKEIDFQLAMMQHLAEQEMTLQVPGAIPDLQNRLRTPLGPPEARRWMRLQSWVPGRLIRDVNPPSAALRINLGGACAQLQQALRTFDHPAAHRTYLWDPSRMLDARSWRKQVSQPDDALLLDYFWSYFASSVEPRLGELPMGVNHNDAHELNILLSEELLEPKVIGFIDFGDAVFTHQLNELAIACAYACMHRPDPLQAAVEIVQGFHAIRPLSEAELACLYGLMAARLVISVARAAYNAAQEPDNDYLQISAAPAWDLLRKLRRVHPRWAEYRFREACGLAPVPQRLQFDAWRARADIKFVLPVPFAKPEISRLDLSVDSLDLGHYGHYQTIEAFSQKIDTLLEGGGCGWGGYGETRPFYTTDAYTIIGNDGPRWRSVHLGEDFWAAEGTPVRAIWEGEIHSVKDNKGDRNYGPTLILRHQPAEGPVFYSLYGHLDRTSLSRWVRGDKVSAGMEIAQLGSATENGGWPPHLHVQIVLDPLWDDGDFPGVQFPETAPVWLNLCPPLLGKPPIGDLPGTSILAHRKEHLGANLSLSYEEPLHMVRGLGAYLMDASGQRFLDTVNNVAHVGHEHPRVVKAGQRQMALLNTNTRYLHSELTSFAAELLATFPPELSVCFFVNSGSEANELALRMARTWSGARDMIAVEVGYHGNTGACIDISSYKFDGKGGNGAPDYVQVVPIPDTYRGLYRAEDPDAGAKYARHVSDAIHRIHEKEHTLAGFICESILSCGGQVVLPPGYLKHVYKEVRAAGGLCIADEVQVGLGRIGSHFWGFELQEVVPDIVTMGKPIGNGHPLAAVVTTAAVADRFANGMEYFNTFGGNPVSAAVGRAVLAVVQEEGLQAKALATGDYLLRGLQDLQHQFPLIGDTRGHGLFLGFELVKDPELLTPAAAEAHYLANRMRQRGVLMSTDGPFHNVLKIKPPMVFGRSEADMFLEELASVMKEDFLKT